MSIEGTFRYNKSFDIVDAAIWARIPRYEKITFTRNVITSGSVLYTFVHSELGEFGRIEVRKTDTLETTLVIEGPSIQPRRDLTLQEFADLAAILDPELRRTQTQQLMERISSEHESQSRRINGLQESVVRALLNNIDADFVLQELRAPHVEPAKRQSSKKKKGKPGSPGLSRADLVKRLAMAHQAEEIKAKEPWKRWKEIADEIGWRFGSGRNGVKLLEYARDRLKRAIKEKDEKLLREIRMARKEKK